MTTIIFIRHGQSESNVKKIFSGHLNPHLTELGKHQAEKTAEYLKQFPISHIYSSDLTRAMETAAPTAKMLGLEIIPSKDLREINAGEWEGHSYEYLKQTYGESYEVWLNNIGEAHPEGGESVVELYNRINREVDRLVQKHRGECIALFSHATPARVLGCRWFGYPPENIGNVPWTTNASLSVVEYHDDGTVRVLQYGYDRHQGDDVTANPKGLV